MEIIEKLVSEGAEAVVGKCTEITMLINQTDCSILTFDTKFIHATAAVDFALNSPDCNSTRILVIQ